MSVNLKTFDWTARTPFTFVQWTRAQKTTRIGYGVMVSTEGRFWRAYPVHMYRKGHRAWCAATGLKTPHGGYNPVFKLSPEAWPVFHADAVLALYAVDPGALTEPEALVAPAPGADLEAALGYLEELNGEICANWLHYFPEDDYDPLDLLTTTRAVEDAMGLEGSALAEALETIRDTVECSIRLPELDEIGLGGTARSLFRAVGLRP